jgi:hypothetical protein
MKNIHVLLTAKSSRLFYNKKDSIFTIDNDFENVIEEDWFQDYNIYITSDEEIKEGDYVCASGGFRFVKTLNNDKGRTFKDDGIVSKQNPSSICHLSNYKKIILTTDQDLIKDGVQAIDDEFLEWFVKNPSCEEVEVVGDDCYYEIIIPKEEPKQETLEGDLLDTAIQVVGSNNVTTIREFLVKHKWQQERMYSEVVEFAEWCDDMGYTQVANSFWKSLNDEKGKTTKELFEQFKT